MMKGIFYCFEINFFCDSRELDKIAKSKKNTDVDLEIYKSKAQER